MLPIPATNRWSISSSLSRPLRPARPRRRTAADHPADSGSGPRWARAATGEGATNSSPKVRGSTKRSSRPSDRRRTAWVWRASGRSGCGVCGGLGGVCGGLGGLGSGHGGRLRLGVAQPLPGHPGGGLLGLLLRPPLAPAPVRPLQDHAGVEPLGVVRPFVAHLVAGHLVVLAGGMLL